MSADFRPYVNLRPLDISPAQAYLDSIEVARTVFPGFDLRPGTIEDAMFQAFAYMSALNIGSINRLPDSLMLGLGKMLGTPYADGERATMDVVFTANSNDGGVVPAGTLIAYSPTTDDGESDITYLFETDEAVTISANTLGDPLPESSPVPCTARDVGVIPTIPSGTAMSLQSFSQILYSAVSDGNFVQGSNSETIDEFLTRATANLASMSSALTTGNQLKNYILTAYPTLAKRCKVYDLTDPDGDLEIGDADVAGKVTVYVYGPERNLTLAEKTDLETDISDRSVAGLEVGVADPVLLNFKITATVNYYSDFEAANVSEVIKENLLGQFSPIYCQWSEEKLRENDVLRAIYANPSVHSVESLTISYNDTSGATITGASISGGDATYTCNNTYSIGDEVIVSGITPSGLNFASTARAITSRTDTSFTVSSTGLSGTYSSGGTSSAVSPNWGSVSGSDILYLYKGSLLNLQLEKIVLTMQSFEV